MTASVLVDIRFEATVIHWRGPAPFLFVAVPEIHVAAIAQAARQASYGWGMVPVVAEIGGVRFETSLFPRNGGYVLPLRIAVRRQAGLELDDHVPVRLSVSR